MTDRERAQSAIIGVAALLAVTVVSVAALTVTVGTVVEEGADAAEANAVSTSLDAALETDRSGPHERRLALREGRLRTVERTVRLLDGTVPVAALAVDGLVYTNGNRNVRHVAGATVHEVDGGARLEGEPSVSRRNRTLFLGVTRLDASRVSVGGDATVTLRTNVTHSRRRLSGNGFGVAVETRTPGVWERRFEAAGATTTRRSFDDDGVDSVVARFPTVRTVYVFVHDLNLEVGR